MAFASSFSISLSFTSSAQCSLTDSLSKEPKGLLHYGRDGIVRSLSENATVIHLLRVDESQVHGYIAESTPQKAECITRLWSEANPASISDFQARIAPELERRGSSRIEVASLGVRADLCGVTVRLNNDRCSGGGCGDCKMYGGKPTSFCGSSF